MGIIITASKSEMLEYEGDILKYVPEELKTYELCLTAVRGW